jgi:hypothetical protein
MPADRCLGFLGQQQAAQPAGRVGQGRGDGVMAIQPDRALRCVRRVPWCIMLPRPLTLAAMTGLEALPFRSLRSGELVRAAMVTGALPGGGFPIRAWLQAALDMQLGAVP